MLELNNLSLTIEGDQGAVQILKNIQLNLEKKKLYVITGPNGGGKSSLAKVIMGLYPATEGNILLDGQDITDEGITERARMGIGYAFQQPPRFKGMKVRDLLHLSAGDNFQGKVCDLLYDVGLCASDYMDREINASFSGGELKRVEIASILARNLKVAVFDEPEAGIDLWSFQKLTETFEALHQKHDTTIIIISHQERILRLADEVILIGNGQVQQITSHEDFLREIQQHDAGCRCHDDCVKGGLINVECAG